MNNESNTPDIPKDSIINTGSSVSELERELNTTRLMHDACKQLPAWRLATMSASAQRAHHDALARLSKRELELSYLLETQKASENA